MILILVYFLLINGVLCDFWSDREQLIKDEESQVMGASIVLTDNEQLVNDFLMEIKWKEFDEGFLNPASFIPANHLFDKLDSIEESEVFQFIKSVPKGSLLHGHDTALASADFVFNLTFSENLFACEVDGRIYLKFLKESIVEDDCVWQPIESLRNESADFDVRLKQQLTLIRADHKTVYTDINIVWSHFGQLFQTVDPLITFKPIFESYFYQVLQELYDDNVFYIEFRTTLPTVYDLDGNLYGPVEVTAMYQQVAAEFVSKHPDFLGAKLIYAPVRQVNLETMEYYVETVKALKASFPDFLAGFDLVGQEDMGQPLIQFIDQLQEIKQEVDLFFHAGETNWFGSSTDENLVDAVLLGTTRIGHGFAALKRPDVLNIIKERGIAIEICPISNQVLLLNEDMRNHPGNYLIANNYPVVISNDDPSFWGTQGLSYDWYMAFMGMTSRQTDLRFLKQLAINSIQYSVYDDKEAAVKLWEEKWNQFIDSYTRSIIVKKLKAMNVISLISV